jgi:hypothetical protein
LEKEKSLNYDQVKFFLAQAILAFSFLTFWKRVSLRLYEVLQNVVKYVGKIL